MDETVLRQVREAIKTGKFPGRDPHSVTGHVVSGWRSDADCALCGMRLMPKEVELELEFSPDHGCDNSTAYRVHPQCYAAWQLEREFRLPGAKESCGPSGNWEWLRYAEK
jgi:hypothetical protein